MNLDKSQETTKRKNYNLLLQDLSARLPHKVKLKIRQWKTPVELTTIRRNVLSGNYIINENYKLDDIKPYLRPLSSMTEEEKVRKALIEMVHDTTSDELWVDYNVHKEDALSWLEKQSNTNETINRDKLAQGVLKGAAVNLITWIDYNAAEGNMCLSNMECKDIEDALVSGNWDKIYAYIKKKLEKQDNKSVNIDIESMVSSYKQRLKSQGGVENSPLVSMCLTAFRHGVENTLEELNLKGLKKIDVKTLDPDKVIEWLSPYECVVDHLVEQFKKDFKL